MLYNKQYTLIGKRAFSYIEVEAIVRDIQRDLGLNNLN